MSYVPVSPTGERLRQLREAGVSMHAVARTIGVSETTLVNIAKGHQRHVQAWTANAIARVTIPAILEHETTGYPGIGARRRVAALLAVGWTHAHLRQQTGGVATGDVINDAGRRVEAHTYLAIRETYERLCMTPGPSSRNRTRARRHGWIPPMAWDDDSIDDLNAVPRGVSREGASNHLVDDVDPVAVQLALAGHAVDLTRTERVHAIRQLAAHGLADPQIAQRVGTSTRTVLRDRREHRILSRVEVGSGRLITATAQEGAA